MNIEDKRSFKRYRTRTDCEIMVNGEAIAGKVFDYSDGAGVVVENVPHFSRGTKAGLTIPFLGMIFTGEVAWSRESGKYIRVGFKNVGNFAGNLSHHKLADILIGIQRSGCTGVLGITNGSAVKKVFIKNGDIVFATSNRKDERLGEILVKKGRITLTEYYNASTLMVKSGQKMGKVLVELNLLKPKELFQALNEQIEEIIMSLFDINEGTFEFKEEQLAAEELVTLKISTANIIYQGMKRIDNFIYIKEMCPPDNAMLGLSQNPLNIFQSLSLSPADKDILYAVSRKATLKKILSISSLKDFETLKTVSALLSIRFINILREEGDSLELSLDEILGEISESTPQEFLDKTEQMFARCETLGHHEILGVDKGAPPDAIKRAYFRLSKEYHPDRHFSYPEYDLKGKLVRIFSYLTEAYEILTEPEQKEESKVAVTDSGTETYGASAEKTPVTSETENAWQKKPITHNDNFDSAPPGKTGIQVSGKNEHTESYAEGLGISGYHDAVATDLASPVPEPITEETQDSPSATHDQSQTPSNDIKTSTKEKAVLASAGETVYIGPKKTNKKLISAIALILISIISLVTFFHSQSRKDTDLYPGPMTVHTSSVEMSEKSDNVPQFRDDAFDKILKR